MAIARVSKRLAKYWRSVITCFANGQVVDQPDRKLDDYRQGYPRFAALIAAHDPFFIYRWFCNIRARILLLKQDKLVALEARLHEIDAAESIALFLGKSRADRNIDRLEVIAQLEAGLADYDIFLERAGRALQFSSADQRDILSLRDWLSGNACVARSETEYLDHSKDLLSLGPTKDNALVKFEEWIVAALKVFRPSALKKISQHVSSDSNVFIDTSSFIRRTARGLLLSVITILLISPMIICNFTDDFLVRMVVVVGFVILYLIILLHLARSRAIELVLAGATYATVLIVFVSSTSTE